MNGPRASQGDAARPGERLQKVLARAGYGSRRACEELMLSGRVRVDGNVADRLGMRVGPESRIAVDGRPLISQPAMVYLLLNKPAGYVTTVRDEFGRKTVLDLVPQRERLFPVGRLDADSEGLLLLTNDGELTHRMTHPRFGIEKEYRVLVAGEPGQDDLRRLAEGVEVEGRRTAPAQVAVSERSSAGTWLTVTIHEGRKRQIRRMCEAVGLVVNRLIRTRVGPLALGTLREGQSRPLTEEEVAALKEAVGRGIKHSLIIAIDGPAGSGKSSLAEKIARDHGLLYLDTGAMYRAVTLLALRHKVDLRDEGALARLAAAARITIEPPTKEDGRSYTVQADGQDVTWEIFSPEVGRHVSVVSAVPAVREILARRQRQLALLGNVVVVGRDIGTVVVPEAPIKIFLDASPEVRARRRVAQLRQRDIMVSYDQVLDEILQRDKLDSERETAPLLKAADAMVVNSDHATIEEEAAMVEDLLRRFRASQERA